MSVYSVWDEDEEQEKASAPYRALRTACIEGQMLKIDSLLAEYPQLVRDINKPISISPYLEVPKTALCILAERGFADIIRFSLLKVPGIDVNAPDWNKECPFARAFARHRLDVIDVLLDVPELEVPFFVGKKAMNLLYARGEYDLLRRLLKRLHTILNDVDFPFPFDETCGDKAVADCERLQRLRLVLLLVAPFYCPRLKQKKYRFDMFSLELVRHIACTYFLL